MRQLLCCIYLLLPHIDTKAYELCELFGESIPIRSDESWPIIDQKRKELPLLNNLDQFQSFEPYRQLNFIGELINNKSLLNGIATIFVCIL
jgi:hypothetical protein